MAIINGTNLNNILFGTAANDTINGFGGHDLINGATGNDTIDAGSGNDTVLGESGNDVIAGNEGDDVVFGGEGNDIIGGDDIPFLPLGAGSGNDILDGGAGDDQIFGGGGNDIVYLNAGTDVADGGLGDDTYFLHGLDTGSTLVADAGGIDTVDFSLATSAAIGSLGDGSNGQFSVDGRLIGLGVFGPAANIENAIGSGQDDTILGNALANRIEGGAGNDRLFGAAGNDTLLAGAGTDYLGGGIQTESETSSASAIAGAPFQTFAVTRDVGVFASPAPGQLATQGTSVRVGVEFEIFAPSQPGGSITLYTFSVTVNDPVTGDPVPLSFIIEGHAITEPVISIDASLPATANSTATLTFSETLIIVGLDPNANQTLSINLVATSLGDMGSVVGSRTHSFALQKADLGAIESGDDTFFGGAFGAGVSTLMGGDGNDTYILKDPNDFVQENADEGTDLVQIDQDYTLTFAVENLTLLDGGEGFTGTGNDLNNTITGNGSDNVLNGINGDDTLNGGLGNDNLLGGFGNDTLDGGLGNDVLNGEIGNDAMNGGAGNDVYHVFASDTVTESIAGLAGGIDTVISSNFNHTLATNIENGELAATFGFNLTGNGLDNRLTGNLGDNILNGGLGNDTMTGGDGNDTYFVAQIGDVVVETSTSYAAGLRDAVFSSLATYTLTNHVENLTLQTGAVTGIGNTLDNIIAGNTVANTLIGGAGNDTLNGGAGGDAMDGGAGNDIYVVDSLLDTIVDASGIDTVQTAIQLANPLYAPVENLTLTGSLAINGFGNGLNNRIVGNNAINTLDGGVGNDVLEGFGGNDILLGGVGNDTLNGGTGNDAMTGGAGNDVYTVDALLDTVTEAAGGGTADRVESTITFSLAALTEVEQLTLLGVANINGTGNGLANRITGNNGNNILDGGLGVDILIGGDGNDVYKIDVAGESISELFEQGIDRVESFVSYNLGANVENLTLMGTANLNGTGNDLANRIVGNDGANTLNGGLGVDALIGGAGNDTYRVDEVLDAITETNTGGTDLVISTAITYTLSNFVEDLTLSAGAGASEGYGNGLANRITGNGFDNILDGGAGADILTGGGGDDTYFVDNAGDVVSDSAGVFDTVISTVTRTLESTIENLSLDGGGAINGTGNASGNSIRGNSQSNVLNGLGGDDRLDGREGADTLTGSAGLDVFRFTVLEDVADTITDFVAADDQIEISASAFGGTLAAGAPVQIQINGVLDGTNSQFLYDDNTAELIFDRNGTDAGESFLIAIVLGGQGFLDSPDFLVIP
jgi:trimeric autotransporter adhesin